MDKIGSSDWTVLAVGDAMEERNKARAVARQLWRAFLKVRRERDKSMQLMGRFRDVAQLSISNTDIATWQRDQARNAAPEEAAALCEKEGHGWQTVVSKIEEASRVCEDRFGWKRQLNNRSTALYLAQGREALHLAEKILDLIDKGK